MTKQSLWASLDSKTTHTKTPVTNLFATLSERSKLENTRPDTIDFAKMEAVVEGTLLQKAPRVQAHQNPLNITYYVVKNPQTNEYFRLDAREKFLWDHMDGTHTIRDLALEYYNHFGAFAYEKIIELVFDLKRKTLLEDPYINVYQKLSLWAQSQRLITRIMQVLRHALYWEVHVPHPQRFFAVLYKSAFKRFFSKPAYYFYAIISIVGITAFGFLTITGRFTVIHQEQALGSIALLLVFNLVGLFFHELAHAIATVHFGRVVHKAGFVLYFFWPAFFVDTTDMWMEERPKRIAVSLAGPLVELIIAGAVSVVIFLIPNSSLSTLLYRFALVSYISVFINLNPLLEWDGYFTFMDLVGIPCLRRRSLHFIRYELVPKLSKAERLSRREALFAVFGIFSFAWSTIAVFLSLSFWESHLKGLF